MRPEEAAASDTPRPDTDLTPELHTTLKLDISHTFYKLILSPQKTTFDFLAQMLGFLSGMSLLCRILLAAWHHQSSKNRDRFSFHVICGRRNPVLKCMADIFCLLLVDNRKLEDDRQTVVFGSPLSPHGENALPFTGLQVLSSPRTGDGVSMLIGGGGSTTSGGLPAELQQQFEGAHMQHAPVAPVTGPDGQAIDQDSGMYPITGRSTFAVGSGRAGPHASAGAGSAATTLPRSTSGASATGRNPLGMTGGQGSGQRSTVAATGRESRGGLLGLLAGGNTNSSSYRPEERQPLMPMSP